MATPDNGNPFTDETLTDHPSVEAPPANGNPFADESLTADPGTSTGQITNDVGNTVIVPKDDESFADTMKRAAAHGKTVTQDQINRELATAPGKVATTLAAAPAIGAGGTAALAGVGEGGNALYELAVRHLAGVLPEVEGSEELAKQRLMQMAPKALQIVKDWALPASSIGALLKILSMGGSNKH